MHYAIEEISEFVKQYVAANGDALGVFVVDVRREAENNIVVELDSSEGVDLDFCGSLTAAIHEQFDTDKDDYSLEVGSCGLTSPLRIPKQYEVREGDEVEVLTADGRKLHGKLGASDENGFTLVETVMVKREGEKRKHAEEVETKFGYSDVKYTKPIIEV